MRVGLLSERPDDIAFYSQVVLRVLGEEGISVTSDELNTDTVGTHIYKSIEEKTLYFFSEPLVDIAFYFTDYDDGECARKILDWLSKREQQGIVTPIIVCFPQPHLEGWLCIEQDAVKKVFGIDSGEALVCHPKPKDHIHQLIKNDGDVVKIPRDYYEDLGRNINLSKLSNDKAYKKMRNDLRGIIARHRLRDNPNLFDGDTV